MELESLTLAKVLAGDPSYEVTSGEVWFKGQDILEMDPEERAHLGLFMGFQYPLEIPGINRCSIFVHML
jgi:Fe-S cluster assembly ATP-binding protein